MRVTRLGAPIPLLTMATGGVAATGPSGYVYTSNGSNATYWGENIARITANGSNANTLTGPFVNIAAGANVTLATASNTLTIGSVDPGVSDITSNGSNSRIGGVNLQAGTGIALGVSGQTITITALGGGGSGGGSSSGAVGLVAVAGPVGFSSSLTFGTNVSLAAVAAGVGGAAVTPIIVTAPMELEGYGLFCADTSLLRTAEARLYLDNGSATVDFVVGTDAVFSFTPAGALDRRASVSGAPIRLEPGYYWLVIRCTSATNAFTLRRTSPPTILAWTGHRTKGIVALAATLDLDTGWTNNTGMLAAWAEGRVLGRTTVLT